MIKYLNNKCASCGKEFLNKECVSCGDYLSGLCNCNKCYGETIDYCGKDITIKRFVFR